MRNITVSEPVWKAIAELGKFGESEDDVLRRVFHIPPNTNSSDCPAPSMPEPRTRSAVSSPRRSFATQRMSSYIRNEQLHVEFQDGASRSWPLPPKNDKVALASMREKAVSFARENGATIGQINAVKKALTDAGFHLTR
ncbi:hypothetical protein [Methylococcus sp. EFPC2]|uniref:hypothetical protein n=1 Tax=Methylococcus sp. EFPC2 TaxID=2812648 RepID=UPI001967FC45|nr:hypothetical protein [Methylococcus sp. EFPC2]QSA99298.1 hypothetical protein JWZ97_19370 [Methylococcus sp. EFPC2]